VTFDPVVKVMTYICQARWWFVLLGSSGRQVECEDVSVSQWRSASC